MQLTFTSKMVASLSVIVLLLLFSVGFSAKLSLTLLNDAVDEVYLIIAATALRQDLIIFVL